MDWIGTVFSLGWEQTKKIPSKVYDYISDPQTIDSVKGVGKSIGNKTIDGVIYVKDTIKDKVFFFV